MPLRQLYPKPDAPASVQPQVDIIALHGLNPRGADVKQHALDTWRKPSGSTGRLWLEDDLPKYAPKSRIFLYEYNSSLIFGDKNHFFRSADELLEDIRNERLSDERRPIVFLAHSLGGILAEQAIVNSFNNKRYTSIWLATSGLAFFGTPHNGGRMSLVKLASVAARLASKVRMQPENDIPEAIRDGSLYTEILKEHWRQRLLDFDLISFYESDEKIVSRESASFGIPGDREAIIELKAAHSDMCRFDVSEDDQILLKRVRIPIQEMYEKALKKDTSTKEEEQRRLTVFNYIYSGSTDKRHADLKDRRKGHGYGLLKDQRFVDWQDGISAEKCMWCYGTPGTGKTFLSSFVIDHLSSVKAGASCGVAYIYFERQESQLQRPDQVLRCFLKQLADQSQRVFQFLEDLQTNNVDHGHALSVRELESAIMFAVNHLDKVFLVLDALDECDELEVRRPLLASLSRVQEAGARIFLTSRPHPEDIQISLQSALQFQLKAFEDDILAYIDDFAKSNPRAHRAFQGERKAEIAGRLVDCSNDMFLPIPFFVEYLSQQVTVGDILKELGHLEKYISSERLLDHVYDRAYENLQAQIPKRRDTAAKIFCWLMYARSTLNAKLIRTALAIRAEEYRMDPIHVLDKATLLDVCAGFITWDGTSDEVRFIHSTAQDYLHRKMTIDWNEMQCAVACARYLGFETFQDGPCWGQLHFLERRTEYPLFEYAGKFLRDHVKRCAAEDPELIDAILHLLSHTKNADAYLQVAEASYALESGFDWYPQGSTPLHVASHIGYAPAVTSFMKAHGTSFVKFENSLGQTPLHVAAKQGHATTCQVLLKEGASSQHKDRKGLLPLTWAVWEGHVEVVNAFMEVADVADLLRTRTRAEETLLHLAVRTGHATIASILVQHGVDMHARDSEGRTAFELAKVANDVPLMNVLSSVGNLAKAPVAEDSKHVVATPVPAGSSFFPRYLSYVQAQVSKLIHRKNTLEIDVDPELKNLNLQSLDREPQANPESLESSISREHDDDHTAREAEGVSRNGQPINVSPDAFKRVYEFGDEQCILRSRANDNGPSVQGSEIFDAMSNRPTWICQLDQDVNLRTLLQLPKGFYSINWIFAYRIASDLRSEARTPQIYNCSFGEPLDAAMFGARTYDPSQPFISSNLNAIINPRVTIPLEVPEYQTMKVSESSDDLVLRRKKEGHTIVANPRALRVDWDGPTAFLIKLVSQRSLKGRLWFLGVLLQKHDEQHLETYQPKEVR